MTSLVEKPPKPESTTVAGEVRRLAVAVRRLESTERPPREELRELGERIDSLRVGLGPLPRSPLHDWLDALRDQLRAL